MLVHTFTFDGFYVVLLLLGRIVVTKWSTASFTRLTKRELISDEIMPLDSEDDHEGDDLDADITCLLYTSRCV